MNKIILMFAVLCGCMLQANAQTKDLMYSNKVTLILENHKIQPHITDCQDIIKSLKGALTTKRDCERTKEYFYLFTYKGVDLVMDSCYRVSAWYIEKGKANALFRYNTLELSLGCSYNIVESAFADNFSNYTSTINRGNKVLYSNVYDPKTKQPYDTLVTFEFDCQDKLVKISYRTPM